ncbi:MAG: anthranilate synthase component I family protein [Pyrinomonadaceae bacterium]
MHTLDLTTDELLDALLQIAETETVCILDSCGVGHLGSHLLIAGIKPVEVREINNDDPVKTLALLDDRLTSHLASIFTISYEFGLKLKGVSPRSKNDHTPTEPDVFLASFDALIIHDYDSGKTWLAGNQKKHMQIERRLSSPISNFKSQIPDPNSDLAGESSAAVSNFSRHQYLSAIVTIKECIRQGDTYQTNLTQQLTVKLRDQMSPAEVFTNLRKQHPASFSAFIRRPDSTVISASPERFFRVETPVAGDGSSRKITTSPIKGTRERGATKEQDIALRIDLLNSKKDRAENTMIVDLLRNDLGRVCGYGSVQAEQLCDLEEHPTLFHLVSTVSGTLRDDARFSDILRSLFPCGSITGAPKLSTMRMIDEIETADRGLSMGAIGYCIPPNFAGLEPAIDLSVAIRTMVIRDGVATFNVGGGIVIDSDPAKEYAESLLKAKALLRALGVTQTLFGQTKS